MKITYSLILSCSSACIALIALIVGSVGLGMAVDSNKDNSGLRGFDEQLRLLDKADFSTQNWMEYCDDVSCRWLKLVVNNGDVIGVLCTGFLQPPSNLANLTTTERVSLALQQGVLVCIKDPFVNNAYTVITPSGRSLTFAPGLTQNVLAFRLVLSDDSMSPYSFREDAFFSDRTVDGQFVESGFILGWTPLGTFVYVKTM